MTKFTVPTKEVVNDQNREIFNTLKKIIGFVPNIYALMAYSDTALDTFLKFENATTTYSKKELEIIKLVVSQQNNCLYCLSTHTFFSKMNGFSDAEIIEIRNGNFSSDTRLDVLAELTKEITLNKGYVKEEILQKFFAAGYTKGSLVEAIHTVALVIITNYLHNITQIPIDFSLAPEIEMERI